MTRIKLELVAVDDCCALRLMRTTHLMMVEAYVANASTTKPLGTQYSVSDTDGSCVADVTREDNGIERGMEVTL